MRAIVLLAALGGSLLLTACGIKGPLYLPEVPAKRSSAPPAGGADHNKTAPAPTPKTSDSR